MWGFQGSITPYTLFTDVCSLRGTSTVSMSRREQPGGTVVTVVKKTGNDEVS